jgi:hypothetical protein
MTIDGLLPRLSLRSNLGLKLANAFGVIHGQNFKLRHYPLSNVIARRKSERYSAATPL